MIKPDEPSANLISMRMYPSTPDIISMSSPDPDSRKLRRHGTVNQFQPKERNGDIQRYLRNRAGAINHIPASNRESQPSPPSSEDEEDGDDDDNASETSSYPPTLHATWNSDSSRTTTNETVNLTSPNPPCDLPIVDCSPLFTEQERETVMHILKRMSANLSGKEHRVSIIDRPSSAKSTGEASWDGSSESSDSRSVRQSDLVSVIDTRPDSRAEPRARVMSGASVVSVHQSFVSAPYDIREDPAHDPIVATYPGGTGTVKRNKTWAIPRDGKGASEQTWTQLQQRRWMRDANGGSGPPPSRSVLMLQNQSMLDLENIYGDGIYRAIMPDLPRSASLRLSSTTSLHALEETIRYRQHMEPKTSLLHPTSPPPDQFVAFPTMHDSDSEDDVRSQRTQPTSPPLGMRLDNASVRTLSTPFLYRTARTQSQGTTTLVSPTESKNRSPDYEPEQNEYGLKSFMDISADPDVDDLDDKTAKKGKLKSFFKKAKAGFRQMLNKGQQTGRTRDSLAYA